MAPPKAIALSTDGKRVLSTGALALINNQVDTSSGTIRLKGVFDNKDHALWPGQSVSTRLLIATLKDATFDDYGPAYRYGVDSYGELRCLDAATGQLRWRREHVRFVGMLAEGQDCGVLKKEQPIADLAVGDTAIWAIGDLACSDGSFINQDDQSNDTTCEPVVSTATAKASLNSESSFT